MVKRINIMGIILFFVLVFFPFSFAQETMTITTYYPSPYGSFNQLTTAQLDIQREGATNPEVRCTAYGTGLFGIYRARAARGTLALPSALSSGDSLGFYGFHGYGTNAFSASATAAISAVAAENFSDSAMGTYLIFGTTPTGSTTRQERVRIDAAGQVGIGTASPGSVFEIYNATPLITYNREGSYQWRAGVGGGGVGNIPTSYWGIEDVSLNAARLVIAHTSGNVGIGTTGPGTRFVVANGSGTDRFAVRDSDNNLYAFGAWQTSWSDKRLKRNVTPLGNMLDQVLKINPITYKWKEETKLDDAMHYGVIAQEIREVFPSLVYEDKEGYSNVRRDELQFILIQAIKDLKAENDTLKAKYMQLEARIKILEARLK